MKKMAFLILFFSFFICIDSIAEQSSEKTADSGHQEYLKTLPFRKNVTIHLKKADGNIYEKTFEMLSPVIQQSFITIYAGEEIFIEADEGENNPKNFTHVKENKNPKKTITFKLEQSTDIDDGTGMMLTVFNPFSRPLHYQLEMMPLDKEKLYKTSSCPVLPGKGAIELWPDPIFQIIVGGIYFVKEGDEHICK